MNWLRRAVPVGAALAGLLATLGAAGGLAPAAAQGVSPPEGGQAPGVSRDIRAWLRVETAPPGLLVFVNGDPAGRSPLDSIPVAPGTVHVRVLREDARRFDRDRDEADVPVRAGEVSSVSFDLRPSIALESVPLGAEVVALRDSAKARESPLGGTPLWLKPVFLMGRTLRLSSAGFSDTTLPGSVILALAARRGTAVVALRPTAPILPEHEPGRPLVKRRWFQWALVGLGAGLTGGSAILKHQGDLWYDRYLDSSDRLVLDTYFDKAVRYDRLSLASLAVGQVLFTGGLVLLVGGGGP